MTFGSLLDTVRSAMTARNERAEESAFWRAWKDGDVARAEELASPQLDTDSARHVSFLSAFVRGDYAGALAHYQAIGPRYRRLAELDSVVVEAYLHLRRYAEAQAFAERRFGPRRIPTGLRLRMERPLCTSLTGTSVVPFAAHWLTEYLPGFDVRINGRKAIAHVDTGGPFLVMSCKRARALGIELSSRGYGYHGSKMASFREGMAESFEIGDAVVANVPVMATPSLSGEQDVALFGTNVLQQFLSTLDYPKERLVLSPRGELDLAESHRTLLPGKRTEVPFYLWSDHFMFARGGFGSRRALNFFVDSGLALLLKDERGQNRQVSFLAAPSLYREQGVERQRLERGAFESELPLSMGALSQTGCFVGVEKRPSWSSFGGVRIDGLLGHAFLKRYSWTIDFERGRYVFSVPE